MGLLLAALAGLFAFMACSLPRLTVRPVESAPVVDPDATVETKALFLNLAVLSSSNNTLFGHEDDLAYGVHWRDVSGRSDVLETAGSYPAVYGWDVGGLELGDEANLDGVNFDSMRGWIREGYAQGGVITISWHMYNPVSGENSWDRETRAVANILPGGSHHGLYVAWLNSFADFAASLTSPGTPWNPDEHLIPVEFRPFHEHNGSVFWWGGRNRTDSDFVQLWRFTVEHLRDTRGVHNLLYAFSPDARFMVGDGTFGAFVDLADFEAEYFEAYPGPAYVDVFGLDNYADVETRRREDYEQTISMVVSLARDQEDIKLPALTETGQERLTDDDWWTTFLGRLIRGARTGRGQVAWALVWRNGSEEHHYAPYVRHPSVPDFRQFRNQRYILFEDELPYHLYEWPLP